MVWRAIHSARLRAAGAMAQLEPLTWRCIPAAVGRWLAIIRATPTRPCGPCISTPSGASVPGPMGGTARKRARPAAHSAAGVWGYCCCSSACALAQSAWPKGSMR